MGWPLNSNPPLTSHETAAIHPSHQMDLLVHPKHHDMVTKTYLDRVQWWAVETSGQKAPRCPTCWLRSYQCYCQQIAQQGSAILKDMLTLQKAHVEIVMYYNVVEIGRSANTAHIFSALCPQITTTLVYGDEAGEMELFQRILDEKQMGIEKTCMLYPCSTSIGMDCWLSAVKQQQQSAAVHNPSGSIPSVRLILLDGTYPGASRVARFLAVAAGAFQLSIPCVALDLDKITGCKSAVAGVMYQPAKDKICTFQATALALQQIIVHEAEPGRKLTTAVIGALLADLDMWIQYLLQQRIKLGKSSSRASLKDVDNTPALYVQQIMVSPPPPHLTAIRMLIHCADISCSKYERTAGHSVAADRGILSVQLAVTGTYCYCNCREDTHDSILIVLFISHHKSTACCCRGCDVCDSCSLES